MMVSMLLVRHAQSEWNAHFGATRIDPGLPDPPLTAEGVAQAKDAVAMLRHEGIRRLISSPYRRTLQTAAIFAETLGLGITVEPLVRERCAFSCDQGSHPDRLRAEWPGIDFGDLEPVWWGGAIESIKSLEARVQRFLAKARSIPDSQHVAVISHWGFIRGLTDQELGNVGTVRLHPERLKP